MSVAGGPSCIECGRKAVLVDGERIYPHRRDLYHKRFWLCPCGAYCGCHPNTTKPLGSPAGPRTRVARNAAHRAFDPLWKTKRMRRSSAYAWMARTMQLGPDDAHIGMMSAPQAWLLVDLVKEHFG